MHSAKGAYLIIDKYLVGTWQDTGQQINGKTLFRKKVIEKIKCPTCNAVYLKASYELFHE